MEPEDALATFETIETAHDASQSSAELFTGNSKTSSFSPGTTTRARPSPSPPMSGGPSFPLHIMSSLSEPYGELMRAPNSRGFRMEFLSHRGRSHSLMPAKTTFIQSMPMMNSERTTCRSSTRDFLRTRTCETLIAVTILLNFVAACMETDSEAVGEHADQWVLDLLVFCFVCVVFEFMVRAYAYGKASMEDPWNWLDAFIVVSGFLEYVLRWGHLNLEDVTGIRVLRLCRLLRLLRIARHLRSFRELMKLVQMMGSCFRTLFWSFILLAVVMTMWATIAVEVIHPYVRELQWDNCERCPHAFESVLRADLTLFQTIVAGDSWGQLAVPIIEYKPWTGIIFIGSLLTLVFGVLNLILAVVVDTSADIRAKDVLNRGHEMEYEEFEEKTTLLRIMASIKGNSGTITFRELKEFVRTNDEFANWLRVLDIDATDLRQLFRMVDRDGCGEITAVDFVETLWRTKQTESKTATGFVKDLVRKIHKQQSALDRKLEIKLYEIEKRMKSMETLILDEPRFKELHSRWAESDADSPGEQPLASADRMKEAVSSAMGAAAHAVKHLCRARDLFEGTDFPEAFVAFAQTQTLDKSSCSENEDDSFSLPSESSCAEIPPDLEDLPRHRPDPPPLSSNTDSALAGALLRAARRPHENLSRAGTPVDERGLRPVTPRGPCPSLRGPLGWQPMKPTPAP